MFVTNLSVNNKLRQLYANDIMPICVWLLNKLGMTSFNFWFWFILTSMSSSTQQKLQNSISVLLQNSWHQSKRDESTNRKSEREGWSEIYSFLYCKLVGIPSCPWHIISLTLTHSRAFKNISITHANLIRGFN